MPAYIICSTDPDNLSHIKVNLAPFYFQPLANVQVQSVNTIANIEILNADDWLDFEQTDNQIIGRLSVVVPPFGQNLPVEFGFIGLFELGDTVVNEVSKIPCTLVFGPTERIMEVTTANATYEIKWQIQPEATDAAITVTQTHPTPSDPLAVRKVIEAAFAKATVRRDVTRKGTLKGRRRLGMAWDAVASWVNSRMRELGIGQTADYSGGKKFIWRSPTESFRVTGMSYNWAVLLGFYGMGVEYPIQSKVEQVWSHYADASAPKDVLENFHADGWSFPLLDETHEDFIYYGVCKTEVETLKGLPLAYRLSFELDSTTWTPNTFQGWVDLNSSTGTCQVKYKKAATLPETARVDVVAKIFIGDMGSPVESTVVGLTAYPAKTTESTKGYQLYPAKSTVVFDEKLRVGLFKQGDQHMNISCYWDIPSTSRKFLKFTGAVDANGYGIDDGWSVTVQALHEAGTATIVCWVVNGYTGGTKTWTEYSVQTTVNILSDQIQYDLNILEAPYVGSSMSTPQLYLLANNGYQVFKNDLANPQALEAVQVAAVFQNTFSPGMALSGGGELAVSMNDMDLGNVEYLLVDSNYHPIKLNSPMFITLKVDPVDDPARDISKWVGKLPKDAPTPQQKAQMEEEARKQQEAQLLQKQQEEKKAQVAEVLSKVFERLAMSQEPVPVQPPVPPQQVQPVQQPVQQRYIATEANLTEPLTPLPIDEATDIL
jgi:hypothetical protein